jgi:predicted methyltransferase
LDGSSDLLHGLKLSMCASSKAAGCPAQALGNFALYDYREPTAVPEDLKGAFNVVVADPPYLVCV